MLKDFTSSFFGSPFNQFSIADITVRGVPVGANLQVTIDIKPGKNPNSNNTGSNGRIAVAILSTSTFDAFSVVDQSSLTFGRTGSEDSFAECALEDANKDKRLDLVCQFDVKSAGFQMGDTRGVLHGTTLQGGADHWDRLGEHSPVTVVGLQGGVKCVLRPNRFDQSNGIAALGEHHFFACANALDRVRALLIRFAKAKLSLVVILHSVVMAFGEQELFRKQFHTGATRARD